MKINVAVIGASGYSGLELVRLLSQHPQVKITVVTSERYAGQPLDRVFPTLSPRINILLESLQPEIEEQLSLAAYKPLSIDAVRAVFKKYYDQERFVRILPEGMLPQTGWVRRLKLLR